MNPHRQHHRTGEETPHTLELIAYLLITLALMFLGIPFLFTL
jgi:hypothetical protein